MSVLWTDKTAAMATRGVAIDMWDIYGLSIDTRSLRPGDLFIPLKDIRDGHDFIPVAYEKGAAAVISEYHIEDAPALIVDDSFGALQGLAIAARTRSNAKRIAVTGSVGKTSVKEMLATVFQQAGKTHASVKSFNNHWGVPLTLAGMPQNTQFGVFEMGMNHSGELLALSQLVRPHIAIVTKISGAHLEYFDDIEAIANAKAEIFTHVEKGGFSILPRDSEYFAILENAANRHGTILKTFGRHESADAWIISAYLSPSSSDVVFNIMGERIEFTFPMPGAHWVENAACVLLCAKLAGVDLAVAVNALKNMQKLKGRGETQELMISGLSITLIDESYNANPESMGAAIALLGLSENRKLAILGDMLELGSDELALHAGLANTLKAAKIDQVMCCGKRMKALDEALPQSMRGGWFENADTCQDGLKNNLQNGDTIMIKGSNASGMGKLVATLIAENTNKEQTHVL